jgi:hypothetical protein
MRTFLFPLVAGLTVVFNINSTLLADDKVIVHEWGTFTCLQDENGQAIGGINVDDEPVPQFVFQDSGGQEVGAQYSHDLGNLGLPPYHAGKGWSSNDPAVTMRLETPVIYIYPPKGRSQQSVPMLDVHVDFHGGFLTQFYPYADALPFNGQGEITAKSTSSLNWAGVRMGSTERPVETNDKVWTTPREVSAPLLQVMMHWRGGYGPPDPVGVPQAEHFLFYRGVGHLDSPLYISRDARGIKEDDKISIWPRWRDEADLAVGPEGDIALEALYAEGWLAEIKPDGTCAFRSVSSFQEGARARVHPLAQLSSKFESTDFSADNLIDLKTSMRDALVKEGLYPDEASAMLRTWELSYFKSPGLRFFYIVPRAWVDKVLPLQINGAATEITRVMVGRIELITDTQKAALARLSTGPCPDLAAIKQAAFTVLSKGSLTEQQKLPFYSGEEPLSDLGITVPPLVQDYLSLGRFRDALIIHEQQQHPSTSLAQFIKDNQLASQAN